MDGFTQYQRTAADTAIYPLAGQQRIEGIAYVTLGLTGEAGEIANKVKKIIRDQAGEIEPSVMIGVAEELGDVLWYVAQLATELGVDLGEIAALNAAKLESRALRGTLRGSGDDR